MTHAADEASSKLNGLPVIEEPGQVLQISGNALPLSVITPTYNERKRESNITRSKIEEQKRKFPPSLRSVGRVVTLTQNSGSKACVIQ